MLVKERRDKMWEKKERRSSIPPRWSTSTALRYFIFLWLVLFSSTNSQGGEIPETIEELFDFAEIALSDLVASAYGT